LKLLFLSLCAFTSAYSQTIDELREHIIGQEGYSLSSYYVHGRLHIGIGHKYQKNEVKLHRMTPIQVENLFRKDLRVAQKRALVEISNYSDQPKEVRIMIVALIYNLGGAGFHEFKEFRLAIVKKDYEGAAKALRNSMWSSQLPSRARYYNKILHCYRVFRLE